MFLWTWAFAGPPQEGTVVSFLRKGGILDRKGFFAPTNAKTLWSRETFFSVKSAWAILWCSLATAFGLRFIYSDRRNDDAVNGCLAERQMRH